MLLTLFYMVATWVQSWKLSSLRTRLGTILSGPSKPSIMLNTGVNVWSKDENSENKGKSLDSNNCFSKNVLSSALCNNHADAKLCDLLWYQGDKRLCTIYPEQRIDVSNWLLYPYGKTIFPLFSYNNAQTKLQDNLKLHLLIEADLNNYIPQATFKALEDYGYIVTWMSDENFGVILETDLDYLTKFSTTLMQEHCFINNGLVVTRIESVSVSGKPCICNYERFNILEGKKLSANAQWDAYVTKLRLVSNTARSVYNQSEPISVKEIPGLVVSPGSKPISLQIPTILEINIPSESGSRDYLSSVPSTPPPTPAIMNNHRKLSNEFTKSMDLNSSFMNSISSLSNLSSAQSQELLGKNLKKQDAFKSASNLQVNYQKENIEETMFSQSSLCNSTPSHNGVENGSSHIVKPPNILIYSDSSVMIDNITSLLELTLKENKYTIYPLSFETAKTNIWVDQTKLVIICGNVGNEVSAQFIEYLTQGGRLLALCSDVLKTFLPTFKTAEVRENELVHFSYGKWKHIRMMHHVFCYQASPVKTKFSQDQDEIKYAAPVTPVTANIADKSGKIHQFQVKVLGSEETWQTPSILLAIEPCTGGKAVFSQIHLEADPSQYEFDESKYEALKTSNVSRLEIIRDLLSTHLDIEVNTEQKVPPTYTVAYFLGRHELKLEMLRKMKIKMCENDVLKNGKYQIQFCGSSRLDKSPSSTFLPVMIHRCPENFSTLEYYENLTTELIGRLVIYTDVMTSCMDLINNQSWHHGLAIIPRLQTKGKGRGNNTWLSPDGCAMFALQLHIPLKTPLGERVSLLQHLITVSVILAVKSIPGYENIDIKIKWPNDLYYKGVSKIGGLIISTLLDSANAICNIGCGINLSNSTPTICINDLIQNYNESHGTNLKKLSFERFLALTFTEIEKTFNKVQNGDIQYLYDIYYKHWLHTDTKVTVFSDNGKSEQVQILGIDKFGFLEVQGEKGNIFSVQPDGNTFDILKGLITPRS